MSRAAPEGEYRVRIEPEPRKGQSGKPSKSRANLPFPGHYADETTSSLTVTVKQGDNDVKLELTKAASSSKKDRDDSAGLTALDAPFRLRSIPSRLSKRYFSVCSIESSGDWTS